MTRQPRKKAASEPLRGGPLAGFRIPQPLGSTLPFTLRGMTGFYGSPFHNAATTVRFYGALTWEPAA